MQFYSCPSPKTLMANNSVSYCTEELFFTPSGFKCFTEQGTIQKAYHLNAILQKRSNKTTQSYFSFYVKIGTASKMGMKQLINVEWTSFACHWCCGNYKALSSSPQMEWRTHGLSTCASWYPKKYRMDINIMQYHICSKASQHTILLKYCFWTMHW